MINFTLKQISIADLFNGFVNNEEEGVYTHIRIDGELIKTNIRPPYQREFVYSDDKRNEVIKSMSLNRPLGLIHLAKNSDGTMEVIDGQQRIISICSYLNGDYSVNGICDFLNEKKFDCERFKETAIYQQIMSYNHIIAYIVDGSDDENNVLFLKALWLGVNTGQMSISLLQRRFRVGYGRAGNIVDKMERQGYVSGNEGSKARRVLLSKEDFIDKFGPMDDSDAY